MSHSWLMLADPYYIRQCAAKLRPQVYAEHPGYREQHGSRVIAAPGSDWVVPTCDVMCKITQEDWDAANPDIKKYSLSDLQRAYDLGFGASGEGGSAEIHPDFVDHEDYQQQRLEALRGFK